MKALGNGVDGFRPTPEGPLPPARAAMRAKLLWMSTPALLLSRAEGATPVSGRADALSFTAAGTDWTVQIDPATGFPVRISTREDDPVFGTVEASMEYFSWIGVEGIFMPARLEYRVDGQLMTVTTLPSDMHRYVISRIKILGGSDIAENRFPQDGRFATEVDDLTIRKAHAQISAPHTPQSPDERVAEQAAVLRFFSGQCRGRHRGRLFRIQIHSDFF